MLKINSVKNIYLLFGLSIISAVLHNFLSVSFENESVFFILTFIFLLSFVISVIYSTLSYFKRGEPKNLWKIGFLGLFGVIGLISSPGFYGLFGLLGFFGAKSWKENKK